MNFFTQEVIINFFYNLQFPVDPSLCNKYHALEELGPFTGKFGPERFTEFKDFANVTAGVPGISFENQPIGSGMSAM
jgi:hypothetical protein